MIRRGQAVTIRRSLSGSTTTTHTHRRIPVAQRYCEPEAGVHGIEASTGPPRRRRRGFDNDRVMAVGGTTQRATRTGTGAQGRGLGIVGFVQTVRHVFSRPGIGARLVAAAVTVAGLLPLLLRLPRVAVVACFDAGHPLYEWVPQTNFTGAAHCVTAPAPVVGWTLMIASTLLVQALLLPLILGFGAVLVRGHRRLLRAAGTALTQVLVGLTELLVPGKRPVPVYVRARHAEDGRSRANPRRGPPNCL